MNRKTIVMITALAGVVILFLVITLWPKPQELTSTNDDSSQDLQALPPSERENISSDRIPVGERVMLGTPAGGVEVNNFYVGAKEGEGGAVIFVERPDHFISFNRGGDFWIAVTATPFEAIRVMAEKDFLAALGILKDDACKLSVAVGSLADPGPNGKNLALPLSFCFNRQ